MGSVLHIELQAAEETFEQEVLFHQGRAHQLVYQWIIFKNIWAMNMKEKDT